MTRTRFVTDNHNSVDSVCVCARACVRVCVCARARACVCERALVT